MPPTLVKESVGVKPHNVKQKCDGCGGRITCMMTTTMRILCESPWPKSLHKEGEDNGNS